MKCLFCGADHEAHGDTDPPRADVVMNSIEVKDGELLMTFRDLNSSGLFGIICDTMVKAFREVPGAIN